MSIAVIRRDDFKKLNSILIFILYSLFIHKLISLQIKQSNMKFRRKELSQRQIFVQTPLTGQQSSRLPPLKCSATVSAPKKDRFDKYYISPGLRYRLKTQNPKNNPQNYRDETFVYKNMHKNDFWNWVHPLDKFKLRQQKRCLVEKANLEMLQKFRMHLQNKQSKRVPLLVEQILKGQI